MATNKKPYTHARRVKTGSMGGKKSADTIRQRFLAQARAEAPDASPRVIEAMAEDLRSAYYKERGAMRWAKAAATD